MFMVFLERMAPAHSCRRNTAHSKATNHVSMGCNSRGCTRGTKAAVDAALCSAATLLFQLHVQRDAPASLNGQGDVLQYIERLSTCSGNWMLRVPARSKRNSCTACTNGTMQLDTASPLPVHLPRCGTQYRTDTAYTMRRVHKLPDLSVARTLVLRAPWQSQRA
jgi:hypothetical protein